MSVRVEAPALPGVLWKRLSGERRRTTMSAGTTTAGAPRSVGPPKAETTGAFELELHGFDYIPEQSRTMTLRDLAAVWVGANAYLFFFSVGVIAFSLGLNLWQALVAVVLGNVLFAYVAFASIAGVRAGLPTMTLTRAPFGIHGNRLNAGLAWVTSVCFEALNTVFGVFAVAALLGHATLVYFQRIFAVLLTVVLVAVFAYTVGGVDWGAGPEAPLSFGSTL